MTRKLVILAVLASLTLACMEAAAVPTLSRIEQTPLPTPVKTVLASQKPLPTQTENVLCLPLLGAATVRDADGRAVGWLAANTPVCVIPSPNAVRLQMADGTANTILAACVLGPQKDCK